VSDLVTGARRRVAWGLLDQVVSSASNFVVTILAARALSATQFGAFALGMAVSFVTIALARGMASDPLATAHASDAAPELRWAIRAGAGTATWVPLIVACVVVVPALLVGGILGPVLVALALVLPGLALQDYLRYALIVRGQAKQTFFNGLFWMVIQVPLLMIAIDRGGEASGLVLAWGLSGTLAAGLGLVQVRSWIAGPRQVFAWLRRHRSLWPFYVLDNLVFQITNLGLVLVISLFTSLAQVGGVRAAMTVYAPVTILARGVVGVAVPEMVRRSRSTASVHRSSLVLAFMLMPIGILWAIGTLLIPDWLGRELLGASWELAEPLVFLAGASTVVGLFTVGIVVGIRVLGAGKEGLVGRILVGAVVVVAAIAGAMWDGARGVILALACSAPLRMAAWWWMLNVAVSRAPAPQLELEEQESNA
jgi:O-antigen/teichoic acid export membrane protein